MATKKKTSKSINKREKELEKMVENLEEKIEKIEAAEQLEATERILEKELAAYRKLYRIVAKKCKTQEIHSSSYRKYQLRWKGRLMQKTGCIEEIIE